MGEWKAEFELNTPEIEAEFDLDKSEICAEFSINTSINDYEILDRKPKINGEELVGDKSSEELHLVGDTQEPKVIYGTDENGNQILYREGEGISFDDGKISTSSSITALDLQKCEDYLYLVHYYPKQLDYQNALDYFYRTFHSGNTNYLSGACSAIRKDNYFARNYDWYYSEAVSFVVKKEGNKDRYSSIGMAGGIPKLSKEFVESGEWDDMYNILPFFLVDGINEHGVTVTINVVPAGDNGKTTGTHPEKTGDNICMLQLPSYILDKFSSAQDAVDWILNEAKIYAPYNETIKEEMHFMIADKNNTFIVEFINNEAVLIDNSRNYLTNFYLNGVELDENNKVDPTTVTPYGQGLERYNIITENLDKEPREILELLKYTNAYNADDLSKWWMTEFVAPYHDMGYTYPNLTVLNIPQDFVDCGLLERILDLYEHRTRDGISTWQTVHGCIYDIDKLQFTLLVQEEDIERLKTFQLFPNTGDGKLTIKSNNEIIGSFSANQQLDTEINIDIEESVWERGTGEGSVKTKGSGCIASGDYSVAEGEATHATGEGSHAEGAGTVASGMQAHAEGASSTAFGDRAHAEGIECYAGAVGSHAEGDHTLASTRAEVAHVEGDHTVADNIAEHAQGRFNRSNHNDDSTGFGDAGNTLHSIGIGTGSDIDQRKNAVEVMQNGDTYVVGVGEYDGTNIDEADTLQEVIQTIKLNIETFIFEQSESSDEWVINHNLNKFPSITVVDSGNNIIGCSAQYVDDNNCTLRFNSAFSGKAYLN